MLYIETDFGSLNKDNILIVTTLGLSLQLRFRLRAPEQAEALLRPQAPLLQLQSLRLGYPASKMRLVLAPQRALLDAVPAGRDPAGLIATFGANGQPFRRLYTAVAQIAPATDDEGMAEASQRTRGVAIFEQLDLDQILGRALGATAQRAAFCTITGAKAAGADVADGALGEAVERRANVLAVGEAFAVAFGNDDA